MKDKTIQDQLRMQMIANNRASKLIQFLRTELESADQEIIDAHNRVKFWVDHAAWVGNALINPDGKKFPKNGSIKSAIDQLSEKDKGLLSSIIQLILSDERPIESVLYQLIENQSPQVIEEYNITEEQSLKLNLN